MLLRHILVIAAMLAAAPAGHAQQASDTIAPEAATEVERAGRPPVTARRQMVVAANPLAAQAGLDILRAGGSAADALVAVQTVLGLVEPQSSGIGGGAFLLWYDAETRQVTSFDARETAPMAADEELFLDAAGEPLPFFDAVVGGRSVGVPGVPRLLEAVHQRHGRLAWEDLFGPAIRLAEDGFEVSLRLAQLIAQDAARLSAQPSTRRYFIDGHGQALQPGTVLTNPDYAQTLTTLASKGMHAFYNGEIARQIVEAVREHTTNPGRLGLSDLASYDIVEREPVCIAYRGHEVCGMGPPSSGGLTVAQILGMVSHFDLPQLGPDDPQSWRIIGDATRLAFADRDRYIADSDFVSLPQGLIDPAYLESRSSLLQRPAALATDDVAAGDPPWTRSELRLDGITHSQPATSHFVIVDEDGNIASMTTSIENAFGARLMVAGFLLNNQLTDFSFRPHRDDIAVANRVEPGKRPRSSMAPTIVLRDGEPVLALGSPGGSHIISYVANAVIGLVDWQLDIQQAIERPHLINRTGPYELEAGTSAEQLRDDLEALGYEIEIRDLNSGLHGIALSGSGILGGSDPRREGVALGD